MKKCSLESIINKVLISQKDLLIQSRIQIDKSRLEGTVITDAKWMEFILGQIVNNSIKYRRGSDDRISFISDEDEKQVILCVEDCGVGIAKKDIKRVFDKTFTGENGRKISASTGIGLYICRQLCDKLGHSIWIESEQDSYTRVYIGFGKHAFYNEVMH